MPYNQFCGNCGLLTGKVYFDKDAFIGTGTKNDPIRLKSTEVGKLPQVITFSAIGNKTATDPPFQLVGASSSGLPVSFTTSDASILEIVGTTATIKGSGTVTITASQAGNDIYNPATDTTRQLTIGVGQLLAHWGWKDNNTLPSEADILAFQGSGPFVSGGTITANFAQTAGTPRYLFMAEPATQPVKVRWFENSLNTEPINSTGTWRVVGTVGQFRVYATVFQTTYDSTLEFRTS